VARAGVKGMKKTVYLLLLEDKHYCLIKNMLRLLSSQVTKTERKTFLCLRCSNYFSNKETLATRNEYCQIHNVTKNTLPQTDIQHWRLKTTRIQ